MAVSGSTFASTSPANNERTLPAPVTLRFKDSRLRHFKERRFPSVPRAKIDLLELFDLRLG
jgi:hypothetical protein